MFKAYFLLLLVACWCLYCGLALVMVYCLLLSCCRGFIDGYNILVIYCTVHHNILCYKLQTMLYLHYQLII